MKGSALFLGYGLLPLWAAIVVVFGGGLLPHPSEYWAAAPWLILVAIPACGATLLISTVTFVVHARATGDDARKFRLAASWFWILNLAAGVMIGALWLRNESLERDQKIEEGLALEFVKNHAAVIQKAGSNASIDLSSWTNSGSGSLPLKYEFSIDTGTPTSANADSRLLYAIVSIARVSGARQFTLDCITPLSLGMRESHKDPCKP